MSSAYRTLPRQTVNYSFESVTPRGFYPTQKGRQGLWQLGLRALPSSTVRHEGLIKIQFSLLTDTTVVWGYSCIRETQS